MGDIPNGKQCLPYQSLITRTWSRVHRPWRRLILSILGLTLGTIFFTTLYWDTIDEIPDRWHLPFLNSEPTSSLNSPVDIFSLNPDVVLQQTAIDELIKESESHYTSLLSRQAHGTSQAIQAYRNRRGRHPPPFFDKWVAFAEARKCIIIEDVFDRIYHDLNPFWAIPPEKVRASAAAVQNWIKIQDGKPSRSSTKQIFMDPYFDMIKQIAGFLPDMTVPINHMDEPRVLVPWSNISSNMGVLSSSLQRQDLSHPPLIGHFTKSNDPATAQAQLNFASTVPYWNIVRQGCDPATEATEADIDTDFSTPPKFPDSYPYGTHRGYVQNYTVSQDVCHHYHLRNMHGTFVEPISISTSTELIPMFSGSKLLVNNDILLPAAMYWADKERFSAGKSRTPWRQKRNEVFWRGTASGGRNKADNWTRFQRHRLVSMLNGTQVAMTLANKGTESENQQANAALPHNFPVPDEELYPSLARRLNLLPDWIRSFSNVAFYWLECFPSTRDYGCSYTGSWYRRGRPVSMKRMFINRYLPDVDGNSFSGRFRAFLLSNSLPIKATIYTEWHDDRLIPWKHFVPMDNTYVDLWAILKFFFRNDGKAEKIATEGREWAEKVLRKDDMLVYVYRLLLEYARVIDDNREVIGYREDSA